MNKAIAFLKKMITQIPVPVKFLTFIKIDISSVILMKIRAKFTNNTRQTTPGVPL